MGTVTQYNLGNVQAALGGANPIGMNEYYRGGAYVPTTRTTATREPASGGVFNGTQYWLISGTSAYMRFSPYVNSQIQIPGNGSFVTSYSTGGATYFRFAYVGCCGYGSVQYYSLYRTASSSVSINTGVPSSGQISISQLYGAENP
jgi:hypothetical protein